MYIHQVEVDWKPCYMTPMVAAVWSTLALRFSRVMYCRKLQLDKTGYSYSYG